MGNGREDKKAALEAGGLRTMLIYAVEAATRRAGELDALLNGDGKGN